jgi:hypothetical protein
MEVKYLLNVNDDILPASIKNEFNKIRLEFRGGNNNTNVIIPAFRKLHELHSKGLLFENEVDGDYDDKFVELTNEKLSLFTKEYHKGFKEGYDNNSYLNIDFVDNSDNKIKINRVFTEVYEKFHKLEFYLINIENTGFLCTKLHFYEFGHEVGIFIKCWDIILNNYFLFEEIFNKHYKDDEQQQIEFNRTQANLTPAPNVEESLLCIKNSENKFWKGIPMAVVINHFKLLTERNSKNGEPFLTNEQFISFLKKGFLKDDSQPKQKINYSPREKGLIIKRFYDFYVLAVSEYSHPQKTINFITLFTDCFDNWEQKTIKPFFKPNKTKETW